MKACAIVGRGEESLLGDPAPELRLERERRRRREKSAKTIDVMSKNTKLAGLLPGITNFFFT